jgi:hypothetical protein
MTPLIQAMWKIVPSPQQSVWFDKKDGIVLHDYKVHHETNHIQKP